MMKIELTDDEVTTIMVALDNYATQKRTEWMDSRTPPDAPDMGDEELLDEAGSAEWCWQKLFGIQQEFRNSIADAIGEGETNNLTNALIDPYGLPTWNDT
jgi:hypothetical protein